VRGTDGPGINEGLPTGREGGFATSPAAVTCSSPRRRLAKAGFIAFAPDALYPVGGTDWFDLARWPTLAALARDLEMRDSTRAAIAAEGLGARPFTAPVPPDPPEGSAL